MAEGDSILKLISTTPRDQALAPNHAAVYRWSHYRAYLGQAPCTWLTTSRALRLLASAQLSAHEAYRLFTGSGSIVASWHDFESPVLRRTRRSGLNGHQLAIDWLAAVIAKRAGVPRETLF